MQYRSWSRNFCVGPHGHHFAGDVALLLEDSVEEIKSRLKLFLFLKDLDMLLDPATPVGEVLLQRCPLQHAGGCLVTPGQDTDAGGLKPTRARFCRGSAYPCRLLVKRIECLERQPVGVIAAQRRR